MSLMKAIVVGHVLTAVLVQSGCSPEGKKSEDPKEVTGTPTAYSISPQTGPRKGQFLIRILGYNFSKHAQITVGGKPCEEPQIEEGQGAIFCKVQSFEKAQRADLVITNPNGESYTSASAIEFTQNPEEIERELKHTQEKLKHQAAQVETEKQQKLLEIEKKYAQQTEALKKQHLEKITAERESQRIKAEREKSIQDALEQEKERLRLIGIEQDRTRSALARERDQQMSERSQLAAEQSRLESLEAQIQRRRAQTQQMTEERQHAEGEQARLTQELVVLRANLNRQQQEMANRGPQDRQRSVELAVENQREAVALERIRAQIEQSQQERDQQNSQARIALGNQSDNVRMGNTHQSQIEEGEARLRELEQRVVSLTQEIDANETELNGLLEAERRRAAAAHPHANAPQSLPSASPTPPYPSPRPPSLMPPSPYPSPRPMRTRQQLEQAVAETEQRRNRLIEQQIGHPRQQATITALIDVRAELTELQSELDQHHEWERRAAQVAALQDPHLPLYARRAATSCEGLLDFQITLPQIDHHRENPENAESLLKAACAELNLWLAGDFHTGLGSAAEHYRRALIAMRANQRSNPFNREGDGSILLGTRRYQVNPDFLTEADPYLYRQRMERHRATETLTGIDDQQFHAVIARLRQERGNVHQDTINAIVERLRANDSLRLRFLRAFQSYPAGASFDKFFQTLNPLVAAHSMSNLENQIAFLETRYVFREPQASLGDFISRNLTAYKEVFLERYAEIYGANGLEGLVRLMVPPGLKRTMGFSFGLLHPLNDLSEPQFFPGSDHVPNAAPEDDRRVSLSPTFVGENLLHGGEIHGVQFEGLTPQRMVTLLKMASDKDFRQQPRPAQSLLSAVKPYLTKLPDHFIQQILEPHSSFSEQNPQFATAVRNAFLRHGPNPYFYSGLTGVRIPTEEFWKEMLIHYGYLVEVRAH